jgi:hypothetical protein
VQKHAGAKPFCWAKPAWFDFFFIQFYCAGSHIEHCWEDSKMMKWSVFALCVRVRPEGGGISQIRG